MGGGGSSRGYRGGDSDDNDDDQDGRNFSFGGVSWGSILIGILLGGSSCLNLILLGWNPKEPKVAAAQIETREDQVHST